MARTPLRVAAFAVGLSLLAMALAAPPSALGDDEPNEPRPSPTLVPGAFTTSRVGGIVYHISRPGDTAVVTVLDLDIGQAVDLFVKDPKLVALVADGTVCTNRFVQAGGTRTGVNSLTAQSLQVSLDRPCGKPPS